MARAFDEENVGGSSGAESESKDPKTDRLDILLYWQIKYRKGDWFLAATFNRLSKPFLPNIFRHIWLPGGEAKASVSPPIWKFNLTTPAIRHNVWQLQQIGQTIAKVFHFCPLFVSLNTSLSGNLHTFSSPFQRYPTCLISVCACCWLEDQGGHWHWGVSIQLEFSSTRMWYNHEFTDLPGLLFQVVLAVQSVVDHQLTCP